jgi:hypothetical protein
MPDSPSPDRVTTELAAIRGRQHLASDASLGFARIEERHTALIRVAYEDTPRLLAAVDALLALAADWNETGAKLHDAAERADARGALPERTNLMDGRAQAYQDCAASLREYVARFLLGEDAA